MEHKREVTNGKQTENVIETDCLGEELPEHCTRTDEKAGSIVVHVGHNMTDWVEPFAARMRSWWNSSKKKQMKLQQKNTWIQWGDLKGRRGNQKTYRGEKNHKEEKQRLKEVSKQIKKYIRSKKGAKKLEEIQRVLVKKKSAHHQGERRNHYVTEGNCQCLWGLQQKIYDDQEHEDTEQENEENEHESSIDVQNKDTSEMMRTPEMTTEELQTANNRLKKKANLQTATESEPKTSKHATVRRKKWWDRSSTKSWSNMNLLQRHG